MSWLSELKWSNRLEHLYAMIAGEEELDESVPSTYDRKQGFLFHIAEKIQGGTLPDASEASDGDVLTIADGDPAWAAPSGGGGQFLVTITPTGEDSGTSDKSYSEIAAAAEAGQGVVAVLYNAEATSGYAYLTNLNSASQLATFMYTELGDTLLAALRFRVFDDKTVTILAKTFRAD